MYQKKTYFGSIFIGIDSESHREGCELQFGIYLNFYKELFPAIRFNLLFFKEKNKRISSRIFGTIRARALGFIRRFVEKSIKKKRWFPKNSIFFKNTSKRSSVNSRNYIPPQYSFIDKLIQFIFNKLITII